MGQRQRHDEPGKWHHATNRGIAKRSLFETREDARCFLTYLSCVCRRGLLEVHAFCLLLNHFHLLVRSPRGELSHAMRILQNFYSRWFNRRRKRDGPLFRGRFLSRPVETEAYWWTLVRYIDFNPVKAGVVASPHHFPYGSARYYALPGPQPRWLTRRRIEAEVMGRDGVPYDPSRYRLIFGTPITPQEVELVERRLYSAWTEEDPLDDLLDAAPEQVKEWQQRKVALADGTQPGVPVVTPGTVLELLREHEVSDGDLEVRLRRLRRSGTSLLKAGLLRSVCGLSLRGIARRLDCSISTIHTWERDHRQLLQTHEVYANRAGLVLAEALRRDHARRQGRNRSA